MFLVQTCKLMPAVTFFDRDIMEVAVDVYVTQHSRWKLYLDDVMSQESRNRYKVVVNKLNG